MLMSIDQSLSCSGIVIWSKPVVFATIKTTNNISQIDRIRNIKASIAELVSEHGVTDIVIESLPYGLNSTSVRPLAGLYYCINDLCLDLGITFSEANITAVKKYATGSGRAKKKDMLLAFSKTAVYERAKELGHKQTTGLADIADAFYIGAYHKSKEDVNWSLDEYTK